MKKFNFLTGFIIGALIFGSVGVIGASQYKQITVLVIDDMPLEIDGELVELENPMLNYQGRTYLHFRELFEMLDKDVDFDEETKTIITKTKESDDEMSENIDIPTINGEETIYDKYGFDRMHVHEGIEYVSVVEIVNKHPELGELTIFDFKNYTIFFKTPENDDILEIQPDVLSDNKFLFYYSTYLDTIVPFIKSKQTLQ